jgi:arsenate reductase
MSVKHVLFLCTGNSARSILAEALLAHHGGERFRAHSAGSQPKGQVHAMALDTLERHGLPTTGFRSKSWDEFAQPDAPPIDIVITVCDAAAQETCPIWPGHPATAHWGIPDPAAVTSSPEAQRDAFEQAYRTLDARIRLLSDLPDSVLDDAGLLQQLGAIARRTADPGGTERNEAGGT